MQWICKIIFISLFSSKEKIGGQGRLPVPPLLLFSSMTSFLTVTESTDVRLSLRGYFVCIRGKISIYLDSVQKSPCVSWGGKWSWIFLADESCKGKIINNYILNSSGQHKTALCDSEKECRWLFTFSILLHDNHRYAVFCSNAGRKVWRDQD